MRSVHVVSSSGFNLGFWNVVLFQNINFLLKFKEDRIPKFPDVENFAAIVEINLIKRFRQYFIGVKIGGGD